MSDVKTEAKTEEKKAKPTEPMKPCVWWKAGVVPRQACEQRLEDCKGCPVDTALAKAASHRQRQFFPRDYFDSCCVNACSVADKPCPFAGPCMGNWSRTAPSASRVLSVLGIGPLSIGVNASMIQQVSRRRGLHIDLVSRLGELRRTGRLGASGKLAPADLGLETVEQQFALVAAAALLDCLDSVDVRAFAEALFEGGLASHGLAGSVAEGRTHEEQWDALRAIQGLAILEVLSTFDVGQLRDLQQALAELPTGSSVMANMVVATQRILQPMTKVPARIEPAAAARAAALAGFPDTLLGKNYEDLAVTSAELGAAVVLARVGKLVTDEAAQHAGRVLADELARLVASDAVNVDCVQPILAGIVASGCAMPTEQAVAVATAVRRSFQGRYRKVGDMCADPVAFVGHLAADNLVHEADRFDALVAAEVPAEETERDPALLGCSLPRELFYFGGHAWIRPEADGTVRVGIDELAARLVGRLDAVEMPRKGAHLRQGKPALRLVRGGESVDVPAPIDGDVMIVNRSAIDQPGSIATEPYGSGWLFLVRPTAPERSVPKLLFAQAARTWERAEVERVTGMFRDANVGATAADGATLAHDPLASISGVRWSDVLKKIFRG